MKVLHLTNWYPTKEDPIAGIFIKDYIENLNSNVEQEVVHIQAVLSRNFLQLENIKISNNESSLIVRSKFCKGRIVDWITLLLLLAARIKLGKKWWDVVNIHIAIPIARYPRLLRIIFGSNIIITEHWTAYNSKFNLPNTSNAIKKLQGIFHHGIPIITVSEALAKDIQEFSKCNSFPSFIIPNVIKPEIFKFNANHNFGGPSATFLIVASWGKLKLPFLILESFLKLHIKGYNVRLRIVGEGNQLDEMKSFVNKNGLSGQISFLGRLTKPEIAHEMQMADAFLHASKYETFSIVCAEALFCGTPVIASNIPAISEFINDANGFLCENRIDEWYKTLVKFLAIRNTFNREQISYHAIKRFHPDSVRDKVLKAYNYTINNY